MTYCVGIVTKAGLVLASDSRTNAGFDQVNVCRKMHTFVQPGERVFVILNSGGLSLSQSVITLLRADFDSGRGLAQAASLYDAARIVGGFKDNIGHLVDVVEPATHSGADRGRLRAQGFGYGSRFAGTRLFQF